MRTVWMLAVKRAPPTASSSTTDAVVTTLTGTRAGPPRRNH